MSDKSNFKVIVALKSAKDQKITNVRCAIQFMEKVKYTILPQSEGQFFDLNSIQLANPLTITFEVVNTGKKLGVVAVQIPAEVYSQPEVELADIFTLEYQGEKGESERFTGRYYIIILNKNGITQPLPEDEDSPQILVQPTQPSPVKKDKRDQSPTKAYLQSSGERNQERWKKDQSKKLLKETKYDPPSGKKNQSQTQQTQSGKQSKPASEKKQKANDESDILSTPKKVDQSKSVDEVKQTPFLRYTEKTHMSSTQQIANLEAELECLKGTFSAQEKQMRLLENNKEINDRLQEEFNRSEIKRRELQQIIRESVQDNLNLKEEIQRNLNDLAKDKIGLQSKIRQANQQTEEQIKLNDSLKNQLAAKDKSINDLLDKVLAMEEYAKICRIQQEKIENQDKMIKDQQQSFQKNLGDVAQNIQELEHQRLQAMKEKAQTEQTLQDVIHQMQRLKEHNISLQALVDQLERKLQLALAYEQSAKALKEQNSHLQNDVLDAKNLNDQLNNLINQLRRDIDGLNGQNEQNEKLNKSKHQSLAEALKNLEGRVSTLQDENNQLKKENLGLKEQVNILTLQASLAEDLDKQVDQYKKDYYALLEDNTKLTSTIADLTDQLQLSNQQILELRNEVLRQVGLVQDQESYTNNLKRLMLEMQERGVAYIPAQGDQIDGKLAQWINKNQDGDKYRQLFVREGEGVYQFGNKKVYVKVEQDKILIRSGGGYMTIEEFLQLHQQREMENLQRADPLAALTKNKAVYKKIDNMKQVNQIKGSEMNALKKRD